MKAFQASLDKLEGADTQVLGVSIDSPFSNHAFAQQNGVTFPILGDMSGTAIKAYGLEKDYKIGGVAIKSARRATFLIDEKGVIRAIWRGVKVPGHVESVIEEIKKL